MGFFLKQQYVVTNLGFYIFLLLILRTSYTAQKIISLFAILRCLSL